MYGSPTIDYAHIQQSNSLPQATGYRSWRDWAEEMRRQGYILAGTAFDNMTIDVHVHGNLAKVTIGQSRCSASTTQYETCVEILRVLSSEKNPVR